MQPEFTMQLKCEPRFLEFRYPFGISSGSRTSTPVVFIRLDHENSSGYGEASLPPYLGESHASVLLFLERAGELLKTVHDPLRIASIMQRIDTLSKGDTAAKAAIDIALHDLAGKIMKQPCHTLFGLNKNETPFSTYTIGIGDEDVLEKSIRHVRHSK